MRPPVNRFAVLILTWMAAGPAWAGSARISGGFDPQERTLKWKITNSGNSPIIRILIPHYHIDGEIVTPNGWASQCTNLVGDTVPSEAGVCTFKNTYPESEIPPGATRSFSERLSLAPFKIGRGSVTVEYADGTSETIPDVELSVVPGSGWLEVAASAAVVLLLVLYAILRNRKPKETSPPSMQDEAI